MLKNLESKAFLPYEWFDSIEKVEATALPPISQAWYSTLKEVIYTEFERAWADHHTPTFTDYLVYYNNLHVCPFVQSTILMER